MVRAVKVKHLAWDCVCAAGVVLSFALEADKGANEDEGGGHEAPQGYESDEGTKGHGATALTGPQHLRERVTQTPKAEGWK